MNTSYTKWVNGLAWIIIYERKMSKQIDNTIFLDGMFVYQG